MGFQEKEYTEDPFEGSACEGVILWWDFNQYTACDASGFNFKSESSRIQKALNNARDRDVYFPFINNCYVGHVRSDLRIKFGSTPNEMDFKKSFFPYQSDIPMCENSHRDCSGGRTEAVVSGFYKQAFKEFYGIFMLDADSLEYYSTIKRF